MGIIKALPGRFDVCCLSYLAIDTIETAVFRRDNIDPERISEAP
jgi:hypothetical protein